MKAEEQKKLSLENEIKKAELEIVVMKKKMDQYKDTLKQIGLMAKNMVKTCVALDDKLKFDMDKIGEDFEC